MATVGPGGTDFGRDPASRDAGGMQPGGAFGGDTNPDAGGNRDAILRGMLEGGLAGGAVGLAATRTPAGAALGALAGAAAGGWSAVVEQGIDPRNRDGLSPQQIFRAAKMTVAQKRQAGIFFNAKGQRVGVKKVAAAAVNRLLAGQKLTRNQQTVIGKSVLKMSASQKRTFTNSLALAKYPGQNVNRTQEAFNRPLKQAMQAARKVAKNARKG